MPASTEIRFKIGADTSALSRGFVQAQSIAATGGKQIEKKLGLKEAFKGGILALGVGVEKFAESIARAFAGMPEWAEESYRKIVEATDRGTEALRRNISQRQTAAQQIKTLDNEERRENRAGGKQVQTPLQRYASNLPVVGGWLKNMQEAAGIISAEEKIAEVGEESAKSAERAGQKEELRNRAADQARAQKNADAQKEITNRRALGQANAHEAGQWIAMENEKLSIKNEMSAKETSDARREHLQLQLTQVETKQLEIQAHTREAELATAERIQNIERETAAEGESHQQHITRLKNEAAELDKKARDTSRSEDDRRALRVQSAEKTAAAAKAEYDWRVKTANIKEAEKSSTGRANTTPQGIRARNAARFRRQADAARNQGRFGAARHFMDLANSAEDEFIESDSAGMNGKPDPHQPDTRSDWDKRHGAALAARQRRLQVPARGVQGAASRIPSAAKPPPPAQGNDPLVKMVTHLSNIDKNLAPKKTAGGGDKK